MGRALTHVRPFVPFDDLDLLRLSRQQPQRSRDGFVIGAWASVDR